MVQKNQSKIFKMSFIVSEKNGPHGILLVVTDKNILGKKYEQGKLQLDLSQEFYQGEEKNEQEVKAAFQKARHIHLTGKKSVALGVELDLIDQQRALWISGIPHAETVIG